MKLREFHQPDVWLHQLLVIHLLLDVLSSSAGVFLPHITAGVVGLLKELEPEDTASQRRPSSLQE